MGDTLALIHVAGLNPNQAAAFKGIEVPTHGGAVERDLGGEALTGRGPRRPSTTRTENCVMRSPEGARAASYIAVTARVARRRVLHTQGVSIGIKAGICPRSFGMQGGDARPSTQPSSVWEAGPQTGGPQSFCTSLPATGTDPTASPHSVPAGQPAPCVEAPWQGAARHTGASPSVRSVRLERLLAQRGQFRKTDRTRRAVHRWWTGGPCRRNDCFGRAATIG